MVKIAGTWYWLSGRGIGEVHRHCTSLFFVCKCMYLTKMESGSEDFSKLDIVSLDKISNA